MTTTMKSRSYNQDKLKILSDIICDDIENLLQCLGVYDYRLLDNMVICSCPIHGGDNESAFNLYHTGDSYRGNWKCRSHKCEEIFKSSIIGFIRGCLSKQKYNWSKKGDMTITFSEALDFATEFAKKDLSSIKVSKTQKEKTSFSNTIKLISNNTDTATHTGITRNIIRKNLIVPSKYFISRGFSDNILDKYDVGDCYTEGKEMVNRAVVPVYDNDHKYMVGCSGRIIPEGSPKWKHSSGFRAENTLYNYWYAKEHIKETGVVVLVESPGNVWRLEESGIHNSLCIFGSSLADKQKLLLDISGAMTIIAIMDNDEAGKKAYENIYKKCHRTYNVKNIELNQYNDLAEMSIDSIRYQILPKISEYSL